MVWAVVPLVNTAIIRPPFRLVTSSQRRCREYTGGLADSGITMRDVPKDEVLCVHVAIERFGLTNDRVDQWVVISM